MIHDQVVDLAGTDGQVVLLAWDFEGDSFEFSAREPKDTVGIGADRKYVCTIKGCNINSEIN